METTTNLPVVVGVDGSPSSLAALRHAASMAEALGAPLRAVTTWNAPALLIGGWSPEADAREVLSDAVRAAFDGNPPSGMTSAVLEGATTATLIDESARAQMLVLGSRGLGGFASLRLGSVSAALSQHSHCPVLIMHGEVSAT